MLLVPPQTAAAAWRGLLLCFGLPALSFRSQSPLCRNVVVLFVLFCLFSNCLPHLFFREGGGGRTIPYLLFFRFNSIRFDMFFSMFLLELPLSFNACMLEYVCRACRIQHDGMALHGVLLCSTAQQQRSISVSYFFVTTELVSLHLERNTSTDTGWAGSTLGVLDADGYTERAVQCEEHAHARTHTHFTNGIHKALPRFARPLAGFCWRRKHTHFRVAGCPVETPTTSGVACLPSLPFSSISWGWVGGWVGGPPPVAFVFKFDVGCVAAGSPF